MDVRTTNVTDASFVYWKPRDKNEHVVFVQLNVVVPDAGRKSNDKKKDESFWTKNEHIAMMENTQHHEARSILRVVSDSCT